MVCREPTNHWIFLVSGVAILLLKSSFSSSASTHLKSLSDWNCVTDGVLENLEEEHKDEKCDGTYQSPIDLQLRDVVHDLDLTGIEFYHQPERPSAPMISSTAGANSLRNTGHTIQLQVLAQRIEVGGPGFLNNYKLEQLHFHWGSDDDVGSEHRIDGAAFPMELHLVHWNHVRYSNFSEAAASPQGLAVVGIFFSIADDDDDQVSGTLQKFADNLEMIANSTSVVTFTSREFMLSDLIPTNVRFFRYSGSLTTPPCTENVMWTVMAEPVAVSRRILSKFRDMPRADNGEAIHDNYRPVQAVNGRRVASSFAAPLTAGNDTGVTATTPTSLATHLHLHAAVAMTGVFTMALLQWLE